jgi:hypothetical protein
MRKDTAGRPVALRLSGSRPSRFLTRQRHDRPVAPYSRMSVRATEPCPLPVTQAPLSMRCSRNVGVGQTTQQQAFYNVVNVTPKVGHRSAGSNPYPREKPIEPRPVIALRNVAGRSGSTWSENGLIQRTASDIGRGRRPGGVGGGRGRSCAVNGQTERRRRRLVRPIDRVWCDRGMMQPQRPLPSFQPIALADRHEQHGMCWVAFHLLA